MKRRTLPAALALLLILLGLTAWRLSPKIASLQPQEGPLHGRQPLQITFSRPMQTESVRAHLVLEPEVDSLLRWEQAGKQLTIQPLEHWPEGAEVTVGVRAGALSRLNLPVLAAWQTELPVSPTLLAYLWPADGPSGLYVLNPDTGESHRMVSHPAEILDFTISPDGLTVYFSSFSAGGDSVIYRYDRLSGNTHPVIKCGAGICQNPTLAENGRDMLYEYSFQEPGVNPGVDWYTLGKGDPEPVGPAADHLTDPVWGPEGWLSVYNRTRQQYHLINTETNQEITLPNQTGGPGTWSNLGPAFVTTEIYNLSDTLAPRHLLKFNPEQETLSDLTRDNFLEDANPVYSPSGSQLAFGRKSLEPSAWSPGRQLWIREEPSGTTYQLTEAVDYNHTAFTWDPPESRLAYVRYNQAELAEPPEIWLMDLITGENYRLLINGFAPLWIP